MVMSIVFHLTANIKFCICLAVYEYTSNVSRSRTTLASLLGPTALQLPRGRQHWLWGLTPRLLAAAAAGPEGTVTVQLFVSYRLLFFLEFPLLDIFSVSISSLCLDSVSFMLHRWSLIMLN